MSYLPAAASSAPLTGTPFDIAADLDTPVSAFLKLRPFRPRFLLESVEGGERLARYSFIGTDPYLTLRFEGGVASAIQQGYKQTLPYTDPLALLHSYLVEYRPVRLPDLPGVAPQRGFSRQYPTGAAVGHLLGFFDVVRGQDDRHAAGAQTMDHLPHVAP